MLCPALVFASLWPVWVWHFQRLTDNSDEPLGIVALITALALAIARRDEADGQPEGVPGGMAADVRDREPGCAASIVLCALAMAIYGSIYSRAPHLLLAVLAVFAVGFALNVAVAPRKLSAGYWLLLFLSLPLVATLNFYIGYPLRLLVSAIAAPLIAITGFDAVAHGTALQWHSQLIEIDAPCSGIKMLWLALYLSATMACVLQMNLSRAALLSVGAIGSAILGNVLRVTSLFYVEAGIIKLNASAHEFVHQGTGVAAFAILAAGIVYLALTSPRTLRAARVSAPPATVAGTVAKPLDQSVARSMHRSVDRQTDTVTQSASISTSSTSTFIGTTTASKYWIVLLTICFLDLFVPFLPKPNTAGGSALASSTAVASDFAWPDTFEGHALREMPPSGVNARFMREFPGKIRICTDGERTIVMRWLLQPTRQLHPASDCYRASGYAIKWLPMHIDSEGKAWSSFEATQRGHTFRVREIIVDRSRSTWTDPSSWYWSAMLNKTSSPWFAITVSE